MNLCAFEGVEVRRELKSVCVCWPATHPRAVVDGIEHIPNLPTEEVFTSPDWRRTEGTVRATMPLATVGTVVRGHGPIATAEPTVMAHPVVDVAESASVTLIVKLNGPAVVGVPEIVAPVSVKPGGRLPTIENT